MLTGSDADARVRALASSCSQIVQGSLLLLIIFSTVLILIQSLNEVS